MVWRKINEKLTAISKQITMLNDKVNILNVNLKHPHQVITVHTATQKTLDAMQQLNREVSALEVSNVTGRARAVECKYLHFMEEIGMVKVRREGRCVFFTLNPEFRSPSNEK